MESEMNYPMQVGQQVGTLNGPRTRPPDTTLRSNIDIRIAEAENQVQKLKEIKTRLEASNLLDTRITDLHEAMRW